MVVGCGLLVEKLRAVQPATINRQPQATRNPQPSTNGLDSTEVFSRVDEPILLPVVLTIVQLPIAAVEGHQLIVGAALDDLAAARSFRAGMGFFRDRRPDLYGPLLTSDGRTKRQ